MSLIAYLNGMGATKSWGDMICGFDEPVEVVATTYTNQSQTSFLEELIREVMLSPYGLFSSYAEREEYLEDLKGNYDEEEVNSLVAGYEEVINAQVAFEQEREKIQAALAISYAERIEKEAREKLAREKKMREALETRTFDGMNSLAAVGGGQVHVRLARGKVFSPCKYCCHNGVAGRLHPAENGWGEGCTRKACNALHPGEVGWKEAIVYAVAAGRLTFK